MDNQTFHYLEKHKRKLYKKSKKIKKGGLNMLSRLLIAVLNGIIVFIVLEIIVAILALLPVVAVIGTILSPFIIAIAVIVGVLTFLGAIPNYWVGIIK
jgi:uncharacterized membrane protein